MQSGVDISARLKREFKQRSQWGGYVDIPPSRGPNDQRQHGWQFRMSIKPTQENLAKAVEALLTIDVLCKTENHPIFKIMSPKSLPNGRLDLGGHWDATLAFSEAKESRVSPASMDRDQRGKEICVYMEFDSDKNAYQFTRAHYKKIMLALWKAMQDADVDFGYVHPPQDEIAVNHDRSDLPVTPFFYSANKPYTSETVQAYNELCFELLPGQQAEAKQKTATARHGIMHHSKANPQKFKDNPLTGLTITFRDLRRAGIKYPVAREVLSARIAYHAAHLEVRGDELAKEFKTLVNKEIKQFCENHSTTWSMLKLQLKLLEKKQVHALSNALRSLLSDKDAARYFPSCADTPGTNLFVLYRPLLEWVLKHGDVNTQAKVIKHLEGAFHHERQMLLSEFQEKNVVQFFVDHALCEEVEGIIVKIGHAIIDSPLELLALYRRLIHLLHEQATLKRAKLQLLRSEYTNAFSAIVGALSGSALLVSVYFSLIKAEILTQGVFSALYENLDWQTAEEAIFVCLVSTGFLGSGVALYEKNVVLPRLPEDQAVACVSKSSRAVRVIGAELGMVTGLVIGSFLSSDYTGAVQVGVSALFAGLGYKLGKALSKSSVSCCCLFSSNNNEAIGLDSLGGQKSLQASLLEGQDVPSSDHIVSIV